MLSKLIKHDFIGMGKVVLPSNALLVVLTLIAMVLVRTRVLERPGLEALIVTLVFFYMLTIVAVCVTTYLFPVIYYYRSMFSSQGYLTFTLPVSTWTLYLSKVITAFVLYVINLGVLTGIFFALVPMDQNNMTASGMDDMLRNTFNMSLAGLVTWIVVMMLISLLFNAIMYFASINIGQLMAKHKIIGSVLSYLALTTIVQVLATIIVVIVGFSMTNQNPAVISGDVTSTTITVLHNFFNIFTGFLVVIGGALFMISGFILKKKVNLD